MLRPARALRGEDLFSSLWLALLSPFADELFLDGGGAVVLAVGGISFAVALVLRDRDPERPVGLKPLLATVGVTGIFLVAATKSLDQRWLEAPLTIGLVALLALVYAQDRFRLPPPLPRLKPLVRRATALPFLALLSEVFGTLATLFVPSDAHYVGEDARTVGEHLFYVAFGLGLLTMLFTMLVALPRTVIDPRAPRDVAA
ncbi:MAG: hypothetical protein R3B99_27120, partial [Polyangiales bacterium]